MWLTAQEALQRLGSKPQSLYANVSRGRIRARPDPEDARRSQYLAEDVERLASRARGRRPAATVAAEAVQWGEPVLASAISTVIDGRLIYRGVDAAELASGATLEEVAALLWGAVESVQPESPDVPARPSIQSLFGAIAAQAAIGLPSEGRGLAALRREAAAVLGCFAGHLSGRSAGPIHERLAVSWRRPEAADALRRALVLLADHELNASTFAARVTVSTGASLWGGALTGLAALRGPRHGLAAAEVVALAEDIASAPEPMELALARWLGEGRSLPGIGHRLYPDGDIRARSLLASFEVPAAFRELEAAATGLTGDHANIDFALAALTVRFDLPPEAPFVLFAAARVVGWLAHMIEQAQQGHLIRPRARYVGPTTPVHRAPLTI